MMGCCRRNAVGGSRGGEKLPLVDARSEVRRITAEGHVELFEESVEAVHKTCGGEVGGDGLSALSDRST